MEKKKVLAVPYFVQPTTITCQSTCLKMYATYLANIYQISSEGASKSIKSIWADINTGSERPVRKRNSYENMKWWLNKYFFPIIFEVLVISDVDSAIAKVVNKIDHDYPVIISTNHNRTSGHIILVVGYDGFECNRSNPKIEFICHDPFGQFNPQFATGLFGDRRYETGMSLSSGGQNGPGKGVKLDYNGIRRIRQDKHSAGMFILISPII